MGWVCPKPGKLGSVTRGYPQTIASTSLGIASRKNLATCRNSRKTPAVSNVPPVALTIAGSDCSGGAGLQADLKVFTALGVFGMSAVTCVVAETPKKVVSMHPTPLKVFREQLSCCLDGMPVGA